MPINEEILAKLGITGKSFEQRYQTASDLFEVDPKRCIADAKTNLEVWGISSY